jgi:hypothetical protein
VATQVRVFCTRRKRSMSVVASPPPPNLITSPGSSGAPSESGSAHPGTRAAPTDAMAVAPSTASEGVGKRLVRDVTIGGTPMVLPNPTVTVAPSDPKPDVKEGDWDVGRFLQPTTRRVTHSIPRTQGGGWIGTFKAPLLMPPRRPSALDAIISAFQNEWSSAPAQMALGETVNAATASWGKNRGIAQIWFLNAPTVDQSIVSGGSFDCASDTLRRQFIAVCAQSDRTQCIVPPDVKFGGASKDGKDTTIVSVDCVIEAYTDCRPMHAMLFGVFWACVFPKYPHFFIRAQLNVNPELVRSRLSMHSDRCKLEHDQLERDRKTLDEVERLLAPPPPSATASASAPNASDRLLSSLQRLTQFVRK